MEITVLLISGMRHNGCREAVARSLERTSGVQRAHVNLYRAQATVIHESPCTGVDLVEAVITAGYAAAVHSTEKRS